MKKIDTDEIVIFRVWNKSPHSVIALWPCSKAGFGFINSYEHIGQHGGADPRIMVSRTRPAKPYTHILWQDGSG